MILPGPVANAVAGAVSRFHLYPDLDVQRVAAPIIDLPPELEGFTIAQYSDLHVGEGAWEPPHVPLVASLLASEVPDLVVNTGDLVMGDPPLDRIRHYLEPIVTAVPAVPHVAVLGNHDYYEGKRKIEGIGEMLESLGVQLLENRCTSIERDGRALQVAGLTEEADGVDGAVEQLLAAPRPRLLLVHQIEVLETLPQGAADLAVAGHTHGGQLALGPLTPFIVRVLNGSRFVQGRYIVNGIPAYINRGLGCTGVPLRVGARPELTFIRLTSGPGESLTT